MAHINFLEEPRFGFRQFNLKHLELNYFWMMVVLGVFVVTVVSFGLIQRHRVLVASEELTTAMAEAKKASGVKPPVAAAGAPVATIMDALNQRVAWSPILNAIANHTPDTISLSFIKGATLVNRGVQIEGSGADVLATVRYEEELSTLPSFSKVFLKSSVGRESGPPSEASSDKKVDAASTTKPVSGARGMSQPTFEIQAWLK